VTAANLQKNILAQFKLGADSVHGLEHWRRVERLGLMLAEKTGADKDVIRLFAYLHDLKRQNELADPGHGARAAEFVLELHRAGDIDLSEKQLEQLICACRYHSDPDAKSDDVTVMTCWDADRLDLWRVGTTPDPALLNTDAARDSAIIKFSRGISHPIPRIIN
jgi:uncharacterized protein